MILLRIDARRKEFTEETVPPSYRFLGGRGLTAAILAAEVDPACEALGPGNKLILAPGLLGGTMAPCSGRLSAGGKSPLTGGIKEANSGGTVARKLACLGIKAVIIEGTAGEKWQYLHISGQGVRFLPADDLTGKGNYQVARELIARHGPRAGVVSIGPAGEMGYTTASLAVTNMEGWPSRQAARGGLGALLGSKRIKALVVEDTPDARVKVHDEETFRRLARDFARELVNAKKLLTNYGTANLVVPMSNLGGLVTRNYSQGSFAGAESISGERLREIVDQRGGQVGHSCHPGCAIRCSNIYLDESGDYLTSSLEFETLACMGSNLALENLDDIARLDRFCDDFGIDTMDTGGALAVAAEAGLLSFGDGTGALKILEEEVARGTVLGRVIGQGTAVTGRVLGVRRTPAVKGQGISAYDPRGLKGTGVTYITSPMGADHTAGNALPGRTGYRPGVTGELDPHQARGQVALSHDLQVMTAVCDVLGFCFFVGTTKQNMATFARLLAAATGEEWDREAVLNLGKRTIKTELGFNRRAGITAAWDRIPEFFREEPLPPYNLTFDIPQEEIAAIWADLAEIPELP